MGIKKCKRESEKLSETKRRKKKERRTETG
jgi:hypothetical protein